MLIRNRYETSTRQYGICKPVISIQPTYPFIKDLSMLGNQTLHPYTIIIIKATSLMDIRVYITGLWNNKRKWLSSLTKLLALTAISSSRLINKMCSIGRDSRLNIQSWPICIVFKENAICWSHSLLSSSLEFTRPYTMYFYSNVLLSYWLFSYVHNPKSGYFILNVNIDRS